MRRPLALVAGLLAGLVMTAHPAQAKFYVRVTIEGPALIEPIELPKTDVRIGCQFSKPCHAVPKPPDGSLGPRFTVTQSLEGHHARGPMMDRIVHDLYPFAPDGPWLFTPSGQTWHDWNRIRRVPGGWTPAHRSLMKALRANGLLSAPPVERIAAASTTSQQTSEGESSPAGVLVAVSVLLAGGAILRRPGWRRRSPGA